jgi:hypothetical protein
MPSVQALSANGPTMFAENYCYRLKCCALQAGEMLCSAERAAAEPPRACLP